MEKPTEICHISAVFLSDKNRKTTHYDDEGWAQMRFQYRVYNTYTLVVNELKIMSVVSKIAKNVTIRVGDFVADCESAYIVYTEPAPSSEAITTTRASDIDITVECANTRPKVKAKRRVSQSAATTAASDESGVSQLNKTANNSIIVTTESINNINSPVNSLYTAVTTATSQTSNVLNMTVRCETPTPVSEDATKTAIESTSEANVQAQFDGTIEQTFTTVPGSAKYTPTPTTHSFASFYTLLEISSLFTPVQFKKRPIISLIDTPPRTLVLTSPTISEPLESPQHSDNEHISTTEDTVINTKNATILPSTSLETEVTTVNVKKTITAETATFVPIVLPHAINLKNVQYITTTAFSKKTILTQVYVRPTMTTKPLGCFKKPCHNIEDPDDELARVVTPILSQLSILSCKEDEIEQINKEEIEPSPCSGAKNAPFTEPDSVNNESQYSFEDGATNVTSTRPASVDNESHQSSNEENVYCEICTKESFKKDNLNRILCQPYVSRIHYNHKGPTFMCTRCNNKYRSMLDLKVHLHLSHPALYLCNYCELSSIARDFLLNHIDEAHATNIKKAYGSGLKEMILWSCMVHMQVHLKTYNCIICVISFATEAQLKTHLYDRHRVMLCYCCGFCEFTCFEVLELTSHLLVHQEVVHLSRLCKKDINIPEMPPLDQIHECDICQYTCSTEETLKVHKCIHQIYCVKCNRVCGKGNNMSSHKCFDKQYWLPRCAIRKYKPQLKCDDCRFTSDDVCMMMLHVAKKLYSKNRAQKSALNFATLVTEPNRNSDLLNGGRSSRCKGPKKCKKEKPCKYCVLDLPIKYAKPKCKPKSKSKPKPKA